MNINELLPDDMFPMVMTSATTNMQFVVEAGTPEAEEIMWNRVKMVRQSYLFQSDWTQGADSPLSESKKEEWRIYRETLRNLPQNFQHPKQVIFPTPPE